MLDQNSRKYLLSSQDLMYSMLTLKANSLCNLKSYNAEKFLTNKFKICCAWTLHYNDPHQ